MGVWFIITHVVMSAWADGSLSWENSLREAAENNANLAAAQAVLRKAEAQVSAAYSAFLPSIAGSADASRTNTTDAAAVSTNGDRISVGLGVSWDLFHGLRDLSKLQLAQWNLESSKAALELVKANLHLELKKAFTQLLYVQKVISLNQEIAKRRKDNLDMVRLRFQGGRENKGSYYRSKAIYRQAQFDVSQSGRNLRVAQKQLARILGRDLLLPITVEGSFNVKALPEPTLDFKALARETPSVRQSSADLNVSRKALAQSKSTLVPSLTASGSVSLFGTSFDLNNNRWTAGLTLAVPLFDWSNFANISAAKSEELRAEYALQNAEQAAGVALEESLATLRNSVERIEVQQEVLEAAALRAEIARAQYTSGLSTYLDWDIIENDWISQRQNLLSAQRDALFAEAAWEQSLGKGELP